MIADFINFDNIDPIVMYFFEFKYEFDKDDLSYIWQNLAPRDYKKITFQESSVAHDLMNTELLEEQNIVDEQVRMTQEAINALPPMYKRYMVERFLNNKSYSDILDIMKNIEKGINLQTVKNRIFRGRKIVKKQLLGMKLFSEA